VAELNSQPPLYRCGGHVGFSPLISADPRRVDAVKLEREVQVRFTAVDCTVHTREGAVHARPGDAILTGGAGESWRVSRAHFAEKYHPVPPTAAGADGAYRSISRTIHAVRMHQPFAVLLVDGESRLTGNPGDWLVDYGDGSLGIVAPAIFADTYRVDG
jgi:hypothetical protein